MLSSWDGLPSALPPSNVKVFEARQPPAQKAAAVRDQAAASQSARRIVAETVVRAPPDTVWRVLTDYERLPQFVPNLLSCERLPCPKPRKVWIRQRGCSQGTLWRLEANAVLEVEEVRDAEAGRREARFSLVEGDFKELNGRWVVEPAPGGAGGQSTLLRYEISLLPWFALPNTITSYVLRTGLPANISAVAQQAEQVAVSMLGASGLARWAGVEEDVPLPTAPFDFSSAVGGSVAERQQAFSMAAALGAGVGAPWQPAAEEGPDAARAAGAAAALGAEVGNPWDLGDADSGGGGSGALAADAGGADRAGEARFEQADQLPAAGPFWPSGSSYEAAAPLTAARQRQAAAAAAARSAYLGVVSVPLPVAGFRGDDADQQRELDEAQRQKEALQASYPAFGLRRAASPAGGVDDEGASASGLPAGLAAALASAEVHLRRLDGIDTLHRRAVAAITIDTAAQDVWDVLTDYNRLAEFIPNLAVSERIRLPPSAPPNVIRVRQVGYKRVAYMSLHGESVLDLVERWGPGGGADGAEIQFRQVAGDFLRFQGKWMLQEIPDPQSPECPQTQLKYAVEVVIGNTSRMLGAIEPLLEQVVFEELPTNLAAIKRRVEVLAVEQRAQVLEAAGDGAAASALRRRAERPPLELLREDWGALVAELQRCFGDARELPGRSELREMGRTDLEKAISAHGGPSTVAQQLGWRLKTKKRRPKGYWDRIANVKQEVDDFIEEQQLPLGVMPLKMDFIRAGRYDLARAVERWGGLYQLAEELGYPVSESSRPGGQGPTEWSEHIQDVAATTGLGGKQGLFELAARTYWSRSMDSADAGSCCSSMDASDSELGELADELLAGAVAAPRDAQGSYSYASSNDAGGNGAGSAAGNGSRTPRAARRRQPARQKDMSKRMPSVREEIDAW